MAYQHQGRNPKPSELIEIAMNKRGSQSKGMESVLFNQSDLPHTHTLLSLTRIGVGESHFKCRLILSHGNVLVAIFALRLYGGKQVRSLSSITRYEGCAMYAVTRPVCGMHTPYAGCITLIKSVCLVFVSQTPLDNRNASSSFLLVEYI